MSKLKVWAVMPSAQAAHVPEQLDKWQAAGYTLGVMVDPGKLKLDLGLRDQDMLIQCPYPGVWKAWNLLAKAAVAHGADAVVMLGDDMDPDPTKDAQTIAQEYLHRFPDGFGVMQPCGDPQGELIDGKRNAARICGSPWVGRGWITRAYMGYGPVCDEYKRFYADEELPLIAQRLGVMWWRLDLMQYHRHWSWGHMKKQDYHERDSGLFKPDRDVFNRRRAEGFPGGEVDSRSVSRLE